MYRLDGSQRGELKRLAASATPGGWKAQNNKVTRGREFQSSVLRNPTLATCDRAVDAEFIAGANPSVVGALLAENENLRVALGDIARLSTESDSDDFSAILKLAMLALFGREDVPKEALY